MSLEGRPRGALQVEVLPRCVWNPTSTAMLLLRGLVHHTNKPDYMAGTRVLFIVMFPHAGQPELQERDIQVSGGKTHHLKMRLVVLRQRLVLSLACEDNANPWKTCAENGR